MADHIRIQIERMEELRSRLLQLASDLQDIRGDIRHIDLDRSNGSSAKVRMSSVSLGCVSRRIDGDRVKECLSSVAGALGEMNRYTHAVAGSIGMAVDAFVDTERQLVSQFGVLMQGESSMFQDVCQILGIDSDRSKWRSDTRKEFDRLINTGKLVVESGMGMLIHKGASYLFDGNGLLASFEESSTLSGLKQSAKIYSGDGMVQVENKLGFDTMGVKVKHDLIEQKKIGDPALYFNEDGNLIEDDKKKPKKLGQKVDVLSIGASSSVAASVWHQEGKIENEKGKAEGSVGVLNAKANASAKGGLGAYLPNENGELELYAGIDAQAGMSVSAVEIKGSAEYELIDNVKVGLEGDVELLSLGAEASASFGIIGGELAAHVKAGAEANLVEVNGEAGVDVAGVKGTVGAGVQVGVGASAEAGYKDGVISVDASLSVGVGVSVNVELDISGLVDNVGEAVESVGNAVRSFADGIGSICGWWG